MHGAWAFRDSDALGLGVEADSPPDETESFPDDPWLARGFSRKAREKPVNESNMAASNTTGAFFCDPRDTQSPQYCRDGTKCADVAGCSADMESCACPEVPTSMGDKIEAVRSDWLPDKYTLTKIKNTLIKLLQYVPPEFAGGVEGAAVVAEYTGSFGCDPFLTCEARPLRMDRLVVATLKFTAFVLKMAP